MPITTVKVIEGVFSDDQKAQLIDNVIEAMVKVEGEGMRDLTWVLIEEVKGRLDDRRHADQPETAGDHVVAIGREHRGSRRSAVAAPATASPPPRNQAYARSLVSSRTAQQHNKASREAAAPDRRQ
jgi:4-oxalocrotonate tautomerase